MAINLLFGRKEPGRIGDLVLDATISETHDFGNEVTSFPVETGADISDHIKRESERITLEGFVTDTPVKYLGGLIGKSLKITDDERVKTAFEELMAIAGYDYPDQVATKTAAPNTAKVVDIVTGLRVYSNMIMTRLSIPRGARTGTTLQFTAEFTRIRFTRSEFVFIANTRVVRPSAARINDQGASRVDTGKQTAVTVESSRLKKLFDKGTSLVRTFK